MAVLTSEDYDYRTCVCAGNSISPRWRWYLLRRPGGRQEPGYLVLTPLRLEGGGEALVNRGFVAQSRWGGAWRSEPRTTRILRADARASGRNLFTPRTIRKGPVVYADPQRSRRR